jgi:hypothetical protein
LDFPADRGPSTTQISGGFVKKSFSLLCLVAAAAIAGPSPSAPGETASPRGKAPTATPTPTILMRTDPEVIEDTPTYTIRRLKKTDYLRVDDKHLRSPVVPLNIEYFKEDDQYFYVYTAKLVRDEEEAKGEALTEAMPPQPGITPGKAPADGGDHGMPPEDFEDLTPARVPAAFRLEEVKPSGLPGQGMWRHSFVVADMNGDGIPDIIAPPARLGGDATLHIWLGDGKGGFARQKLTYTENGKPKANFSIDYGAVAVGDIDGDGKMDVATASHAAGLIVLFGQGDGAYAISRKGLPVRDFSSRAIVLTDVNGDGKLDIVASWDKYEPTTGAKWDPHQLRVYLYDGAQGWKYSPDALVDGAYSYALEAWDYNRDGKTDVLTGSNAYGAVQLLWKNLGNGKFAVEFFPQIEIYGYHFAVAPGTFGKERAPAFADAFTRATNVPVRLNAEGVTVYASKDGAWTRHRVWRKKEGKTSLNALAMGDIDGDGLDDVVFGDSTDDVFTLRVFLQQADGTFKEADAKQEPRLDSQAQCIRLADLNRDGRLDFVVSKTYSAGRTKDPGGWSVYLNRK